MCIIGVSSPTLFYYCYSIFPFYFQNNQLLLSGTSIDLGLLTTEIGLIGPVTASSPVSCSAKITADTLQINGSEVDFTNLPTSDPGVSGRLYNDSGTVKISAG